MKNQLLKLFLIFICIFLNANSNAQNTNNYESIFGNNETYWNYYINQFGDDPPQLVGDIIFILSDELYTNTTTGETYRVFDGGYVDEDSNEFIIVAPEFYYLREDTGTGKVWLLQPQFSEDEEILVIDMNLEVGDDFDFLTAEGTQTTTVTNVYYQNNLKHIVFDYSEDIEVGDEIISQDLVFIEGVGSSLGYLNYAFRKHLVCSEKDGIPTFENDETAFDSFCVLSMLNSTSFENSLNIYVYPNPAKNKLFIKSPNQNNLNLEIFNLEGKSVAQHQLKNTRKVNISNLNSGIYLVKVKTENGATFTQKLIVK
ncbi:T9SS type A sorting domain-containing protein [Psychroflexus aestuariivivens]|uniref:T9SS type A sorting domain-containing protein n=1 Tax=Psychroflexus aestuariivivens TaxID=1795040 RepID=UPI000FD971FB|nr:T9SS type A sorting domain-containing protein [Psychroflexus aestuariivivens]